MIAFNNFTNSVGPELVKLSIDESVEVAAERSAPEQKVFPVPVMTITRTAGSKPACSKKLQVIAMACGLSRFRKSGRLRVTVAIASVTV
jgi:hypothetical protein